MTTNTTISALRERFPIGSEIINLGCIRAVVEVHNILAGNHILLVCREIKPDGRLARGRFSADPGKCEPANPGMKHKDGFVTFG